ncbi:MAG TPA: Na+/H+ antiporter NhaC family protein [Candidatus Babeliales bacterium]|nr:Na+/H+ antiporter NhaC family protein [Candidatus Babeliales bacterium]
MILISFLPILLFVFTYVGSGIYFSYTGVNNAFYQLSPTVAILPAIIFGWIIHKGTTNQKMNQFLDGVRHPDIITMCIIFILAGAFSTVTSAIGSVDATINLALSLISPQFLLIGLFITAAFISTAIGTSMGTIATIAPIAAGLIQQGAFSAPIGMATVVGGAMFGDNLSIISDTTIAAVMSQEADMKAKLRINGIVACFASMVTLIILFFVQDADIAIPHQPYSLLLIAPYLLLIALAISGINVFVVLMSSLAFAGCVGALHHGYTLLSFSNDIVKGFASMHEIMLLSLMVGGLSGLAGKDIHAFATHLAQWISKTRNPQKYAQLAIAAIVSIFVFLFANNTIAIIFSGVIARDIAKQYQIPPHYSAAWLDIFSCVFQGLIPYGAQILLASSIAGISPLNIVPHVYYCYALGVVSVVYIATHQSLKIKQMQPIS